MTTPNLKPQYAQSFAGGTYSVQNVYDHWGTAHGNPFIDGTPQAAEFQEIINGVMAAKIAALLGKAKELKVVRQPSKRRLSQPVFKPVYDTLHDIRLRLERTLIFVGSGLYYVRDVFQQPETKEFILRLYDADNGDWFINYNSPDIDLRSPEPQYVTYNREPLFFYRPPARQNQQGLMPNNFRVTRVGTGDKVPLSDATPLMRGLSADILPFSSNYLELINRGVLPSLRLSKDVAIYTEKGGLKAEYRGRFLGDMIGNEILLDKNDITRPWIRRAVENVACIPGTK